MDCNNYKGIVLFNSAYEIFPKILLTRLKLYISGGYLRGIPMWVAKCGSTTEQLAVIRQIIEKKYEYRQSIWQVFINFRKAYENIHRDRLCHIMNDFGFPEKLIKLTIMCMVETKYRVKL